LDQIEANSLEDAYILSKPDTYSETSTYFLTLIELFILTPGNSLHRMEVYQKEFSKSIPLYSIDRPYYCTYPFLSQEVQEP